MGHVRDTKKEEILLRECLKVAAERADGGAQKSYIFTYSSYQ